MREIQDKDISLHLVHLYLFFSYRSLCQPLAFSIRALQVIDSFFVCVLFLGPKIYQNQSIQHGVLPYSVKSTSPCLDSFPSHCVCSLADSIKPMFGLPELLDCRPFNSFSPLPTRLHPFNQKSLVNLALLLSHFKNRYFIPLQYMCFWNQEDIKRWLTGNVIIGRRYLLNKLRTLILFIHVVENVPLWQKWVD